MDCAQFELYTTDFGGTNLKRNCIRRCATLKMWASMSRNLVSPWPVEGIAFPFLCVCVRERERESAKSCGVKRGKYRERSWTRHLIHSIGILMLAFRRLHWGTFSFPLFAKFGTKLSRQAAVARSLQFVRGLSPRSLSYSNCTPNCLKRLYSLTRLGTDRTENTVLNFCILSFL
jgi:hypothetical protein